MNDPFKAITGVSIAGVVTLFALYGKPFWSAALGAWLFLLEITKTAPLGLASFLAALMLGTMLDLALERWVPDHVYNPNARKALIEMAALIASAAVAWVQLGNLNGLLFGILAGLMAPLSARVMIGFATYVGHRFRGTK